VKVTLLPDAEHRPRHLAVGEFDGVHLGHREVIRGADTVLTFEPHPRAVIAPDAAPKLLTPIDVKADLIAGLGVRELVVIPFDESFAAQSPQAFIDRVLIEGLGAERVSVGDNFRFGAKAQGDAPLLQAQEAFETRVVPLVEVDGEIVSSTHVRGLIVAGDLEQANRFLGSPYELRGLVVHGDKRGRDLGYPTANLVPDNALCYPGHGVYACRAAVRAGGDGDGEWRSYPAATNVGVRPTFVTGRGVLIEAYLIDFEGDLYGQELRLTFLQRLRGERRFDSVDELIEQMHADVAQARGVGDRGQRVHPNL
jgi:riboflavin kinase/FMN adenylyltransferase